jgi:hypothetical protein
VTISQHLVEVSPLLPIVSLFTKINGSFSCLPGFLFDKTLFFKLEIIPDIHNIRQLISHVIELSDVLPEAECVILVTPKDPGNETDLSRSIQRLGLSYLLY